MTKKTSKSAKPFKKLTKAQRETIARRVNTAIRVFNRIGGGRYKIVSSPDNKLRERGYIEYGSEADILDHSKRGSMLDLARNQVRNSSTFNALLKQFDLNAVGTVGGKASFIFPDVQLSSSMREAFAKWATDCEFFDGYRLNDLLKIVLKTYLIGGEIVLLFDDNLVEDSGRILVYEPDEIGNLKPEQFEKIFGNAYSQVNGHIKDANSRTVGVIVSRSERGNQFFDAAGCYILERDPATPACDSPWINPRNVWRKNQTIGISPAASALGTVIDLEDLSNYELQAAKKNSQTLAQVTQTSTPDTALPSAFDPSTDFANMTDAQIEEAVAMENADAEPTVTLDQIKGAGAIYEVMPEGSRLELLDTKHPNQNMPEFIRWLAGRAAAPFGLGSVYATLKADASYTAFRGEQVMSWPAFEEAQKFLEHICDWIMARWSAWAARRGFFDFNLPPNWQRSVAWAWPKMREVNQVDEQNAIEKKLKNGTGTYAEVYGADWRERLVMVADEIEFCKEHGIPHPATITVSGAVIGENAPTATITKENEQ